MNAAPLPLLPADVMGRIAHVTLAAEGGPQERAWARLSLVCRTWRDSLRGAYVDICGIRIIARCAPRLQGRERLELEAVIPTMDCPSTLQISGACRCAAACGA